MAGYTQTPAGWREVRLGDVARERNQRANSALRADVLSITNDLGFVQSRQKFDRQVFSQDTSNYKVVRRGDIAYNPARLNVGSIGILTNPEIGIVSPMYVVFESDTTQSLPEFLFRLLRLPSLFATYRRFGEGTVRSSIGFHLLRNVALAIPPKEEQKHILVILDAIDDAIERTEAVIAATECLRNALLHELLTRGVPGWHTAWKDAPGLGTIPASWVVVRLGEILESTTYGTSEPLSTRGEMVVLRMNNLQNGEIDLSEVRRADLSKKEVHELNLVPGDILFNRTNSLDLVGKVGIVRNLPELISFASYLIRLRAVASRANSFWLSALLWSPNYQSRIRKFATPGVSQANINPTSLRSLTIPLPPLQEQEATAKLLDGVDVTLAVARGEREGLQLLKESITDALLTGRVRVEVGKGIHGQ